MRTLNPEDVKDTDLLLVRWPGEYEYEEDEEENKCFRYSVLALSNRMSGIMVQTFMGYRRGRQHDDCLVTRDWNNTFWGSGLHYYTVVAVKKFDSKTQRDEFMLNSSIPHPKDVEWDWEMRFDNRYFDYRGGLLKVPYWTDDAKYGI